MVNNFEESDTDEILCPLGWDEKKRYINDFNMNILNKRLSLYQSSAGIGTTVWDVAILFSKYLETLIKYENHYNSLKFHLIHNNNKSPPKKSNYQSISLISRYLSKIHSKSVINTMKNHPDSDNFSCKRIHLQSKNVDMKMLKLKSSLESIYFDNDSDQPSSQLNLPSTSQIINYKTCNNFIYNHDFLIKNKKNLFNSHYHYQHYYMSFPIFRQLLPSTNQSSKTTFYNYDLSFPTNISLPLCYCKKFKTKCNQIQTHHFFKKTKYNSHSFSYYFSDKKIIELGSGTGLLGIVASLLGAYVILTDTEDMLPLLKKNIQRNIDNSFKHRVRVEELSWGSDISRFKNEPIDIILACECLYNETVFSFIQTVYTLLCYNNDCFLWLGYEARNIIEEDIFWYEFVPYLFDYQYIDNNFISSKFRPTEGQLYIFKLKDTISRHNDDFFIKLLNNVIQKRKISLISLQQTSDRKE